MKIISYLIGMTILLLGCQSQMFSQKKIDDLYGLSTGHLNQQPQSDKSQIPQIVASPPILQQPQLLKQQEKHTVVVSNVPINELLFSLARDAKLNLDINNDVTGTITINAIEQPLIAILDRIADNSNIIYSIKNDVLKIRMDTPFIKNYSIDYINMSRTSSSNSTVSTQINSTGQGAGAESNSSGGNNSSTDVSNTSDNQFWQSIENNVAMIISGDQEDSDSSESNNNIITNRETGILAVRATNKQHRVISEFINEILHSSQRQVLIEATIAEVTLSKGYQAGINWSLVGDQLSDTITNVSQSFIDTSLTAGSNFTLSQTNNSGSDSIQSTLTALETFGNVSIMSSPKVMALNNQTALLKVVDNLVYFTVGVNIEAGDDTSSDVVTYETTIQTVPVGFVMSVTPFISQSENVTLNIRPTISRVIGQARDPNPELARVGVISEVPIIQVREVESMLKVATGDIAVIGGLMQDESSTGDKGIPFLGRIPIIGSLFKYKDERIKKTELVIFIRPTVVNQANLNGDFKQFNQYLPLSNSQTNLTPTN
ncbi:pilus (MSHA type) biogenesis protein MshL [Marinicellulosiphila megalodicopiae]|uniref:pilus (MSHA type) biogenesis protein MshL n=1 Tax=Marinicellulosiphila megalodicopiae TaxID=2724896 RepID=UPI003BB12C5E